MNRNLVEALTGLAWCKLYAGAIEEVMPLVEHAIRLSPRDRATGHRYYLIGTVHLLQSRTDEAIPWGDPFVPMLVCTRPREIAGDAVQRAGCLHPLGVIPASCSRTAHTAPVSWPPRPCATAAW